MYKIQKQLVRQYHTDLLKPVKLHIFISLFLTKNRE